MKQETLEGAVKRICSNQDINYSGISTGSKYQEQETLLGKTISKKDADKDSFEDVTNYKIERMYSEEDMKEAFQVGFNVGYNDDTSPSYLTAEKFVEQFKKK